MHDDEPLTANALRIEPRPRSSLLGGGVRKEELRLVVGQPGLHEKVPLVLDDVPSLVGLGAVTVEDVRLQAGAGGDLDGPAFARAAQQGVTHRAITPREVDDQIVARERDVLRDPQLLPQRRQSSALAGRLDDTVDPVEAVHQTARARGDKHVQARLREGPVQRPKGRLTQDDVSEVLVLDGEDAARRVHAGGRRWRNGASSGSASSRVSWARKASTGNVQLPRDSPA